MTGKDKLKSEEKLSSSLTLNPKTCRICLEESVTEDNPFVAPCSCTGSVKFLHIKCL